MTTLTSSIFTHEPRVYEDLALKVGAYSIIEATPEAPVELGRDVVIGHHSLVAGRVRLADSVFVDNYTSVGANSSVGANTRLLYGSKVFEMVTIGERCLIGGEVANWSILGDDVTFMGIVAHSYRQPAPIEEWNTGAVPSPRICDGAVIGEAALLIGGITIGLGAYIAAKETVKCHVPAHSLYIGGRVIPLDKFHGFIRARR